MCKPFSLLDSLLQPAQQAEATAAAPPLLDVPLLLCGSRLAGAGITSPDSLRLQLGQLAAGSVEQTADASGGFVSLRQLSAMQAGSMNQQEQEQQQQHQYLAAPTPVQLAEPPPAPLLLSFLLCPSKPTGNCSPSSAASPQHSELFFTVEAPVLLTAGTACTAGPAVGAPTSAFAHLFEPVAVPAEVMPLCFAPEGSQAASLASLIAQDMLLDDGGLVLPALHMAEEDGREAQSGGCCCCCSTN